MTGSAAPFRLGRAVPSRATLRSAAAATLPRWRGLAPAPRRVAVGLMLWSLAFPLALAVLLGPEPVAEAPAATPAPRSAAAPDGLDAILNRPLFNRSRRPPAPMIQPAPMPPAPPARDRQLVVRGIVIRGDAAKAFITSAAAPDGAWVGVGDAIGGWHVAAIRPRDVALQADGETFAAPMSAMSGP